MNKSFNLNNRIALGTVQFGLDYGINNKKGRVKRNEVFEILDYAVMNGIDLLDTAHGYGESEKVIGEFIKDRRVNFNIISKLPSSTKENVEKYFFESLERLTLGTIYGYIFHDFQSFIKNPEILDILNKLKEEEKIKKIGFSLYYPKELTYLIERNIDFDIIQFPYSIFDQRFSPYIKKIKEEMNIEIHIRSVFLQGLVFKTIEEINGRFLKIKPKLETLRKISNDKKIPISALCLNFVILCPYIDKVVIGVDSIENLKENIEDLKYNEKVREIYNEIECLSEDDEEIIIPSNWSR